MQPIIEITTIEEFYEAKACEFINQGFRPKKLASIQLIKQEIDELG